MSSDTPPIRPRVVVSECLGFAAVRYNGQILKSRFVESLREHVEFVQVCPEVGIGLGVPRDPIRIEVGAAPGGAGGARAGAGHDGGARAAGEESRPGDEPGRRLRLVQPSTARDLTAAMEAFSERFLGGVGPVDGFILKTKSPSCAVMDAKRFPAGGDAPLGERGPGLFAREVLARFPHAAVQDEGRLTNYRLRHHFLTHLWAAARLRKAEEEGTMGALVRFHTEHKLLLMACGEAAMREMARLVANAEGRPPGKVFDAYRDGFARALAEPPRRGLLTLLRGWIVRFDERYLAEQRYFEPYPPALMDLSDAGGGAG